MPAIAAMTEACPAATMATARRDPAARGPHACDPAAVDLDPGHLGVLDQVHAEGIGGARVAPRDVVVLRDAAPRLVVAPRTG